MTNIELNSGAVLREIGPDDAQGMFSLIDSQREYLGEWLPFVPFTREVADSEAFILSVVNAPEERRELVFAILVDGNFAGTIGFKDTDHTNLRTEIGYWLGEQYQGRGIVSEAVSALCNYAFGALGMNRIQIKCAVGNSKSSNIPKRLGFTFEGIERDGEMIGENSFRDVEVYSKLACD